MEPEEGEKLPGFLDEPEALEANKLRWIFLPAT